MIGHSGSTPLFTTRFLYAVLIPCYFSQRNRMLPDIRYLARNGRCFRPCHDKSDV